MESSPDNAALTLRTVNITIDDCDQLLTVAEYQQLSAMEKIRAIRERRFIDHQAGRRAASVGPAVIGYCILTMPLTMPLAVLPYTCSAQPSTLPYWRIGFLYVAAMTISNWLLQMRYESNVRQPIARPPHLIGRTPERPPDKSKADFLWTFPPEPGTGLRWRWCQKCDSHAPPRTHHCPICDACILLRDHHCFFTGRCIGAFNQRFAAPFALHCMLICLLVLFLSPPYLFKAFAAAGVNPWLAFFIPPYAVFHFLFGGLSFTNLVVISHMAIVVWGWLICLFAFVQQTSVNFLGRTSFEISSSDAIFWTRVGVVNQLGICERQRRIYGRLWALNFICPMHWLFATPQDGWEHPGVVDARVLMKNEL